MNLVEKILGALHINFLNRKNSPSQENTVKMKNSSIGTLQQAGGNIYNAGTETPIKGRKPFIDVIAPPQKTGGPGGHFVTFKIKNLGKETAIGNRVEIQGAGYHWAPDNAEALSILEPGKEFTFDYPLSNEKVFQSEVPGLKISFYYKDTDGNEWQSGRMLRQVKVPSGAFYTFVLEGYIPN